MPQKGERLMSKDYNSTLNLPKTDFPMRAGLPKSEPLILKAWEDKDIYNKIMKKNESKTKYVVHDGPPYANGNIHMGHALNKILKEFVVRYKNMTGYLSPFVPGWDTHGLPTELKARAKAGIEGKKDISDVELRKLCKEFVLSYVDDQRNQFKRLGILADWEHPYITLQKEFEAKQIEMFAEMADKGYIYRGLKPVYWCADCQTALAEAEIEYFNDKCYSIYVKFMLSEDNGKIAKFGADISRTYFVIWTTTAWTLPGNVAVCVGPDFDYALVKSDDEYYIMAKDLCDKVMGAAMKENYEILGILKGRELEYMQVEHPFLDRKSLVIVGDHVTLESGTGCVHTAPGHGVEDFEVCKNYKEFPVIVPVNSAGVLTEEAGEFSGLEVEQASKPITEYLKQTGALFAIKKIEHQYPHCWRCKKPILFRATEQFFCSIDKFKDKALEEIKKVRWIPAWGEDRITSMVQERKDWCISRQRKWGVPIPIFFCKDCGDPLIDKNVMLKVADLFRKEGSDACFFKSEEKILETCKVECKNCKGHNFKKGTDIMDVWFDSGSTHLSVCKARSELSYPANLYLEGADQYRGWFQSSLLTSVATENIAPYKEVVTHGWVVDGDGKKQSKSLGNGIEPQNVINQYGADILRLWVSSANYHADMKISGEILKQLSEAYRKIRNTARYILGNLYDFDPDNDTLSFKEILPLDRWMLSKLDLLIDKVLKAYDNFEFYQVYHSIYNFCVVNLSNFYLDVLKDRLYVEKKDGKLRRAAQTTIYLILDAMVRLLCPILAFTTEEIWQHMPHRKTDNKESVLLNDMPEKLNIDIDEIFINKWDKIAEVRDDVQKALEIARINNVIGSSLEARVELYCEGSLYDLLKENQDELKEIFIISEVNVNKAGGGEIKGEKNPDLSITVLRASGEKCERCWSYSKTIVEDAEDKICERCKSILNN